MRDSLPRIRLRLQAGGLDADEQRNGFQGAVSGEHLSEPARSTKDSLPRVTFCVCRLVASMQTEMMRWLRELSLFICVLATCLRCWPLQRRNQLSSAHSMAWLTVTTIWA